MLRRCQSTTLVALWTAFGMCTLFTGCMHPMHPEVAPACGGQMPRELTKVSLPAYTIEPPDVLLIDALQVVPRPPYHIQPLDALNIQFPVDQTSLKKEDLDFLQLNNLILNALFTVDSDGTVNPGPAFGGQVSVVGKTVEEAADAIAKRLKVKLKKEIVDAGKVSVSLAQSRGLQQIRGEHLVRPDGTVNMGTYGSVYVTGLTLAEARAAIERFLSKHLLQPEISLDVLGYNSKVYYVILDNAGAGDQVYRFPITGNETVLDAISQVNGLLLVSSKRDIWVARPAPDDGKGCQQLPVNWIAITQDGSTATNYQVLPGDRIYVKGDKWNRADVWLIKVLTPLERILGFTLLGRGTERSFEHTTGTGTSSGTGGV